MSHLYPVHINLPCIDRSAQGMPRQALGHAHVSVVWSAPAKMEAQRNRLCLIRALSDGFLRAAMADRCEGDVEVHLPAFSSAVCRLCQYGRLILYLPTPK